MRKPALPALILVVTIAIGLAGCEKLPPLSDAVRTARGELEASIAEAARAAPASDSLAAGDSLAAAPRAVAVDSVALWVAEFYRSRGDEPMWFDDHGARPAAGRALTGLLQIADHGLDPEDYAPDSLRAAVGAAPSRERVRVDELPRLGRDDVAFTLACARAAHDLACGRVDPAALDPDWRVAPRRAETMRRLRGALTHGLEPEALLAFAPKDSDYFRLQQAYAKRLHERRADASLLTTMAMNLERRRWIAFDRAVPRLEVNIPDFQLAYHAGGDTTRAFRVVVGDTAHQTPLFTDAVAWLDMHPGWRLGRRIVAEEIAPAWRRDHGYLDKHDMEVVRTDRKGLPIVSPDSVPWDSVVTERHFPYLVRQRPGLKNPLGKVKFACPNDYDVYLHDTNARSLFQRDYRALSHGCVRVARAETLAALLLAPTKWAPIDSLAQMFRDTVGRRITLPAEVPVDFLYWTAWVDAAGELHVRRDLYGLDRRLAAALKPGHTQRFVLNPEVDWRAPRRKRATAASSAPSLSP